MIPYRLKSTIQLGIKSLLLHKLRSALTMLGIVFGVCSVIAMLAIGQGASFEAQERIRRLGSNNIIIRSEKPPEQAQQNNTQGRSFAIQYGITYEDCARILSSVPGVLRVLPQRIIRESARAGNQMAAVQVVGTYPFYPELSVASVVGGRFISAVDERYQANVCAVNTSLSRQLFPADNPIGRSILVGEHYYRIVGIVEERNDPSQRSQSGEMEGQPLDSYVYLPLSTTRVRFGETLVRRTSGSFEAETVELHQVTVQMDSDESVETADLQIRRMLENNHDQEDYEVIVPLELLRQAKATERMFNIVLGSIAAISLLVGGIGIMNIMLATVTERTREIGVRRALGAKKRDITTQFLVETVVLSLGGGLIGVFLGIITPLMVSALTDMKTIVTWWAVALAFGISGVVGVIFGIYPANSAASLDPIEALRYE